MYIAPGQGGGAHIAPGDKVLMSTETSCHQAVSKEMFKECGWRTTDRRTTDGRWRPIYHISSPVSLRLRWAKKAKLHTPVWDGVGAEHRLFRLSPQCGGKCWGCDFLNVAVDKVWNKDYQLEPDGRKVSAIPRGCVGARLQMTGVLFG